MNLTKVKNWVITFGIGIAVVMSVMLFPTDDAMAATKYSNWSAYRQASHYSNIYSGTTADGTYFSNTFNVKYVAVPMDRIVSKSAWKKLSAAKKYTKFYYGEKLQIKRTYKGKTYYCKVTVKDCGASNNFGGCGCYYNGKWRNRVFDFTGGAAKQLHIYDTGVGVVKFRYVK